MSVAHVSTVGDIIGSVILLQLGAVLMSMACVTIKGHADVHGLYCHLKPYGCPLARLPLGALWVSMAYAATGDYAEVHGTC